MSDGGKGSGARPLSVSKDQFAANWDAIFGKKEKKAVTPVEKFNECPVPCVDCEKHNTDCFIIAYDEKFALVGE